MDWFIAYVITTAIVMMLVWITAKIRGDFPKDLRGRLIASVLAMIPVLNVVYGVVIFTFFRKPQGFA
jgi:hypothetical protein